MHYVSFSNQHCWQQQNMKRTKLPSRLYQAHAYCMYIQLWKSIRVFNNLLIGFLQSLQRCICLSELLDHYFDLIAKHYNSLNMWSCFYIDFAYTRFTTNQQSDVTQFQLIWYQQTKLVSSSTVTLLIRQLAHNHALSYIQYANHLMVTPPTLFIIPCRANQVPVLVPAAGGRLPRFKIKQCAHF